MEMMDIELASAIRDIVAEETKIPADKLTLDTSLEQLGIDSLMVVKLAACIEQTFDVRISTSELQEVNTLRDIIDGLGRKLRD